MSLKSEILAICGRFLRNLAGGARLACLAKPQLAVSLGQLVALLAGGWVCAFIADWHALRAWGAVSQWGVVSEAARSYCWLAIIALLTIVSRTPRAFVALTLALAAADLSLWVSWLAITSLGPFAAPTVYGKIAAHLGWIFIAWQAAVFVRAWHYARGALGRGFPLYLAVYVGALYVNMNVLPDYPLLDAKSARAAAPALDIEDTYYRQRELLERAGATLSTGVVGKVELFLVEFGGYGAENVFKREVLQVGRIMAARFGTAARTLQLINSYPSVAQHPLANGHNLKTALAQIASHMQRDEDVLLLFLTSHGSASGEFAVELGDLGLKPLTPAALRRTLDESGITWRVVVVSACYSGQFLAPLAEPHTLVITAAAADKTSFGCAHARHWTYFGEAYFKDALATTHSFITAFKQAERAIAARERREGKEPSQPQIAIGAKIKDQLARLESSLEGEGR